MILDDGTEVMTVRELISSLKEAGLPAHHAEEIGFALIRGDKIRDEIKDELEVLLATISEECA